MKKKFNDRVEYYNSNGKRHRLNGPAIEYSNGDQLWFKNGLQHRIDGPAVKLEDMEVWYREGKRHRENGPAYIVYLDGEEIEKMYYLDGSHFTDLSKYNEGLIKLKLNRLKNL